MNNLKQYKNRFYSLLESSMGDVKPLLNEQSSNTTKGTMPHTAQPIPSDKLNLGKVKLINPAMTILADFTHFDTYEMGCRFFGSWKGEEVKYDGFYVFRCKDPIMKNKITQIPFDPKYKDSPYNWELTDDGFKNLSQICGCEEFASTNKPETTTPTA